MTYPGAEHDANWLSHVAPTDYTNPEPEALYHLVVIGAGTAGLISAIGAAGLGAKVALVERHRMGGDCLNVGCVPSKALLAYTDRTENPQFDEAFAWLRGVRADIAPHDSVARYSELGVDVFLGDARFSSRDSVTVGETVLRGRRFAICTGAAASVPPIPGLAESLPLTNDNVFDLTERPEVLGILGAGAIGCELAQVFARLGTRVHLFEMAPRVLPLENERAGQAVADALIDAGVTLHLGNPVERVDDNVIEAAGERVPVSRVLVALGRRPNTTGLSLPLAGVELADGGFIRVDEKLRSTNPHIFAAGDCASPVQFTHHADAQARVVVQNALFAPTAKADGLVVPHCTYTQPEVASVGLSEAALRETGRAFDRYAVDFAELDRGKATPGTSGFAEVLTAKGKDTILGATIVAPDAGELLAPVCLLMSNGLGLAAAGKTIFSYPTRAEFLKRLANDYNRTRLTPVAGKAFARWFRFTGD